MPIFQQMIAKLYVLSRFYVTPLHFGGSHTISDVVSSNAHPLRPVERPTTIISTLTVPVEAMYTREKPEGETLCVVILRRSVERQGPSTLLYSRQFPIFNPLQFLPVLSSLHYCTEDPNQGRLVYP